MRILPLFILHNADAAVCTELQLIGATGSNTDGVFLIEGSNSDIKCEITDDIGDSFPTEHDLAIVSDEWDYDDINNYQSAKHGQWENSSAPTGVTNAINWHLHGEQITNTDSNPDFCYCGKRKTNFVRGRGNWKKSAAVDYTDSNNHEDTVNVQNTTYQTLGNFVGKICLCKDDGTYDTANMTVVDSTDKLLLHGQVGDGTKVCANLLWQFTADIKPLAKICTDAQICDQFGGKEVCVDKTEQLYNTKTSYTKATDTKKYCVRRMTRGAGDVTPTDQRAHRPRADADISKECDANAFCNPYADDPADRCLTNAQVLGDDTVASAVRQKGKATEHCLGIGAAGSKVCTADTHLCNPHADTNTNLCIDSTTVIAHAEAGDPDATPAAKQTCIADNAKQKDCTASEVCNYGAEADANVCLTSEALVGKPTIVKGDNWNTIKLKSLRQEPGKDTELCMARASTFSVTPGGKSFSKQCIKAADATAQVCNPNANSLADVCINKNIVVANHGDQVDFAADPKRIACIGDKHYKLDLAKDTICNMGVTNEVAEVEILLADTLSGTLDEANNVIKGGFNKAGVEVDGVLKWCFDKSQAKQCTTEETCNTAGTYDDDAWSAGTEANATCIETKAIIEHGGKGDDTKMYCLGEEVANKYTADAAADPPVDQCSRASGTLHKADEQLADGTMFDKDNETAARCFAEANGLFYDANCTENYVCNPTGSSNVVCDGTDGNSCSLSNICVHKDAQLAVGGKFEEGKAQSICLAGDKAEQCTKDKPYCGDQGACLLEPEDGGGEGENGEGENASGSSTASLVGLSVAAILSA